MGMKFQDSGKWRMEVERIKNGIITLSSSFFFFFFFSPQGRLVVNLGLNIKNPSETIYIYIYILALICWDQQRELFLQTSAPALLVREVISDDGLALKLDAFA